MRAIARHNHSRCSKNSHHPFFAAAFDAFVAKGLGGHAGILAHGVVDLVDRGQLLDVLTGVQTVQQWYVDVNDDQLRLQGGGGTHQGVTVPNGSHNVVLRFR